LRRQIIVIASEAIQSWDRRVSLVWIASLSLAMTELGSIKDEVR